MTTEHGRHESPPAAHAARSGFAAEVRDAVTPRAALMVIGVLLVQLGFIASYLGAFHAPEPRDIALAVVAPAGAPAGAAQQAAARLNSLRTEDVTPAGPGDARGLSAFYLVVGWVVGGYLVAAILGIGGGARPTNRHRATIRLLTLTAYAVVSGFGGAILAETILDALSGHFLQVWAFGALVVLAVGAFTMAAQVLLGIIGIGVAIVLFVVLGNPSAGGAYPTPLLPRSGPRSGRGCPRGRERVASAGWSTSARPAWTGVWRCSRRTSWSGSP